MADSRIQDLPAIDSLADGDLFPVAREGDSYNARKVTAGQMTDYIEGVAQPYLTGAQEAANQAAMSAASASIAVSQIGTAVEDTQAAQKAAEAARDEAVAAGAGIDEKVTRAETAAQTATEKAGQAATSESNAALSAGSAESAKQAAETAKQAAESAQGAAEAASGTATSSATQAAESAQGAAQSAQDAQTAKEGAEAAQEAIENLGVVGETLSPGEQVQVIKTVGEDGVVTLTFRIPKGLKGDTGDTGPTGQTGPRGVSVVSAEINDSGHLIITLSEGNPLDAGSAVGPQGIQGIQGPQGESVASIQRTSGTGSSGTTDTYTMYSTDGSTIGTFTVYNGQNGTGAGDFMADGSVPMTGPLDMNGNRVTEVGNPTADTDAANKAYVDEALEGVNITTDATPTEDSTNPVQSGGVFDALSNKQDTLTGTEDQLVGFNSAGEATAVPKPTAADLGAMPAVSGGTAGQVLTKTEAGQEWQDAPDGLPSGGEEGQVLTKTSTGAQWDDVPSDIPTGGTQGQVLTKGDGETVEWSDPASGLPSGGTPGQMLYQGESGPEWGDKPVMYVHITGDDDSGYQADKTAQEIYEALQSGYEIIALTGDDFNRTPVYLYSVSHSGGFYSVAFVTTRQNTTEIVGISGTGSGNDVVSYAKLYTCASDISFTPGSTGLTSENVQDAIDELAGEEITAKNVSYDNSTSGMTATDVQAAISELSAALAGGGGVKVESGSYVGTGVYGVGNPTTLQFSGDFYAFVIRENDETPFESGLVIKGDSLFYVRETGAYQMFLTSHDNSIEFYGNVSSGERQLNDSGKVYNYLVFLK